MTDRHNMLIPKGDDSPKVVPGSFDTQPTDPEAAIQYAMNSQAYPEITRHVQIAYALSANVTSKLVQKSK